MGCICSCCKKRCINSLQILFNISSNYFSARNGTTNSSTHSKGSAYVKRKATKRKQLMNNNPKQKIVFALYSYEGREEGDLCFEKGEKLIVLDDKEPDWWLAQRLQTEEKGYIPMNFVVSNIIETEGWFFSKVSRREAEKLLLMNDYPRGTFLVRNSEQESGAFSLSIREFDSIKLDYVKHYKICKSSDGYFYINSRRCFAQLEELVSYYSESSNRMFSRLIKPCPKSARTLGPSVRSDEIDRNDLELKRELGAGNFGKVYYGVFRGQTEVAIKTLIPGKMSRAAFLQEAAIMRKYRHDNLVPLYGVCSIGQPLLIITEYMCNGSLLDYLKKTAEGEACTVIDLIDMAAQITSGMAYLERMKLVHRDLAARNILVKENKIVKVADFGLARIIEEGQYVARVDSKFPIKWTAPEAAYKGKFTSKSDVWSFGVLLYELVTKGQIPYPGMSNCDVLENVERGYRMPKPNLVECPNTIYQVMIDCWDKDPDKRPTFEHLHKYFDDFFS